MIHVGSCRCSSRHGATQHMWSPAIRVMAWPDGTAACERRKMRRQTIAQLKLSDAEPVELRMYRLLSTQLQLTPKTRRQSLTSLAECMVVQATMNKPLRSSKSSQGQACSPSAS